VTVAGCVYPASTTYYEAVEKPWVAAATEGNLAPCPPTQYERISQGANSILVDPSYHSRTGQVAVFVQVRHGDPVALQTWTIRLTSLVDPLVQSSIPLRFHTVCGKLDMNRCPIVSTNVSSKSADYFVGIADVPPELASGFLVEVQDIVDSRSTLGTKAQKFELRGKVLLRGTYGCG
jgi:hypothetical protein